MKDVKVCAEGIVNGKFDLIKSFIYCITVDMNHFISDEQLEYEKMITLPDMKNTDGNFISIKLTFV